jgi:hypothetical protein
VKVLVCGGRDFKDVGFACDFLDELHAKHRFTHVIHGDARGADTVADAWATSRGIQVVRCPANWSYHGKSAGHIRNSAMVGLEPDLVVAFPGGAGTASMTRIAAAHGIECSHVIPGKKWRARQSP